MALCMSSCARADSELSPLVLVMGTDSFPYQFVDDSGEPKGVLVDLWREWAAQTGTVVEFKHLDWQDSLDQLAQGHADIHIGMGHTDSRESRYDFADAITSVNTYLYVRKSLQNKNHLRDLIPYRIGVVSGSSHEANLIKQLSDLNFRYYESRDALLNGVINGEVDVFAGMEGYLRDKAVSRAVMEAFPLEHRLLIKTIPILPAVKQGNQVLQAKINQGFQLVTPAMRAAIEKHWLGFSHDAKRLIIATPVGIEPYVDIGGDGQPHGLYIDIWRLWSQKTGIAVDFRTNTFDATLEDVAYRRADIHIGYPLDEASQTGGVNAVADSSLATTFADTRYADLRPVWQTYRVNSHLFSYQKRLTTLDSLAGHRIGAVASAPYLEQLHNTLPDSELHLFDDVEQMIAAVQQGDINAFVAASAWTQHYLIKADAWQDFYPYRELTFSSDIYALTRSEDEGLIKRIRAGFNLISATELANLESKWILDNNDRTVKASTTALPLSPAQQRYLANLRPLKIGYLQDWPPMEFEGEDGQFQGINHDISQRLAAQLHLTFVPVMFKDWSSMLAALKRGDIDIVGSVALTAEREKELVFSGPYWPSPWGLVTNLNNALVFSLAQMSGKRLAIVEGYHLIPQLMNDTLGIALILVPNTRAGIDAVLQGTADGFIEKVINMGVELSDSDHRQLKMSVLADYSDQQSHFALTAQLQPLVPLLDKAIAQLSTAQQQQIYQRWIEQEPPHSFVSISWKQAFYLLLVVVLMLMLALWWRNAVRKRQSYRPHDIGASLATLSTSTPEFDPLTGLPNRSILDDRLTQAILTHRREMQPFAVLFIDFDNLTQLQQRLDTTQSQQLMNLAINKLSALVRKSDTLAKFNEQQLVAILNHSKDLTQACQVAQAIIDTCSAPFAIDAEDVALSVSIGVAMFPRDGDNAVEILKKADERLSRAAAQGGSCYRSA